ncbi:MAG: carboxypeptidase regulatory-like domain-containing protein [Chitinophagaceae bacterium]|nr:carboxypeptidase regulatory-like domain-containing protein [Chitinophagaceae bacterium]
MKNQNYKCAQSELYTIARLGWSACKDNIAAFTSFKPKYTLAFVADKNEQINAAQHMPSEQQRNAVAETLRVYLAEAGRVCLDNFQALKQYIVEAYPEAVLKAQYEEAGQLYYTAAIKNNWDSIDSLSEHAITYVVKNTTQLSANDNMPPTFQAKLETDRTAFTTLHQDFLKAEEDATTMAEQKIIANNQVYNDLMLMFSDAHRIFKNQEALLKKFTFSDVHYLVSGAGTAGIRGTVTSAVNNKPIPSVTITIDDNGGTAITDDAGKYEISPMASGSYALIVSAPGYETLYLAHEVLTGTLSTRNITLNPSAVTV